MVTSYIPAKIGNDDLTKNPINTMICGCSSMVEQQPSKLMTRVRFPSPAPMVSLAWAMVGVLLHRRRKPELRRKPDRARHDRRRGCGRTRSKADSGRPPRRLCRPPRASCWGVGFRLDQPPWPTWQVGGAKSEILGPANHGPKSGPACPASAPPSFETRGQEPAPPRIRSTSWPRSRYCGATTSISNEPDLGTGRPAGFSPAAVSIVAVMR